jgi:uncharacterized protein with NRDE domain
MCTILILHRVRPDVPLVIAANRDEFYARPSSAPELLPQTPRAIAGIDGVRHGTWMGATAHGFFAGITNQRTFHPANPVLESRGLIVREALRLGDTSAVETWLRTLDARAYNPFNLIFGSTDALRVAYARPTQTAIEFEPVPPGLHILPNDRLGSADFPKVTRVRDLATAALATPLLQLPDHVRAILGDHDSDLQAICLHTPFYGTRSATYIELRPGAVDRYLFADGTPCITPWRDMTALLRD